MADGLTAILAFDTTGAIDYGGAMAKKRNGAAASSGRRALTIRLDANTQRRLTEITMRQTREKGRRVSYNEAIGTLIRAR